MNRVKMLVLLALIALTTLSASAQAAGIRIFTPRSPGVLYEVIEGSRTGGAFVNQYRGVVGGNAIYGYTDRVRRGAQVYTFYQGDFPGDWAFRLGCGYRWNQVRVSYPASPYTAFPSLPQWRVYTVSTNPYDDNMFVFMGYLSWNPDIVKRVPIG